ncbi:Peptide methionine sulfoxide reductase MrsB [Penicillium bovifimosum]|uniref:Peptide methionine sulfoxide reductase MrsB n=1 Tax=Penicillium bovifimosum TaxID=126998 RepID=A0A9W9L012_9EURO|nr:Peptide methionine sulfoxide reductase MrsB [Penicillium bovifimosum]KAJ5129589.1 Peptide methionine sulfoxide reductase MrsB [Penicillium bovifimosum]
MGNHDDELFKARVAPPRHTQHMPIWLLCSLPFPKLTVKLEGMYCPTIDPALFAAIISDYNLAKPNEVAQLRETLDVLAASAVEQEDLPFDPTGTTTLRTSEAADSSTGEPSADAPLSDITSWTSIEHLDQANADLKGSKPAYTFQGMTTAEKAQKLISMFPTITRLEAERILENCHDNLGRAMDVLLNLAFIEETQLAGDAPQETPEEVKARGSSIPKSVDGFHADENQNGGGKKSRKKKQQQQRKAQMSLQTSNTIATNKWEAGNKDIDFLSSRASSLQREKIASAYHANSMSIGATIRTLAQAHAPKDIEEIEDDPRLLTQVGEIGHHFPGIHPTTLAGLIHITNGEVTAISELAEKLESRPALTSPSEIITFVTAPVNIDEEDEEIPPVHQSESSSGYMNLEDSAAAASSHFAARSAALAQASQSARRARSNPLYGGAAAYYREVSNKERQLAMRHLAAASDQLVARQSSPDSLDLHGVSVANAVRIARERVQAWWDGLGDQKHVRGGGQHSHGGFNIICGVGLHSQDRKSHIGPAVWNMLQKEGWRVELNRGSMLVTGFAPTSCSSRLLSGRPWKPPHTKASTKALRAAPTIPFLGAFFSSNRKPEEPNEAMSHPDQRSEDQWRAVLSPEQFRILREKGTERPHTGEYDSHYPSKGVYNCAGCNAPLYTADQKFKSGCGWPAYFDSIPGAVTRHVDSSFGMKRTEIVCTNCGGHLGHVFEGEGYPTPTDERHCVNSWRHPLSVSTLPP